MPRVQGKGARYARSRTRATAAGADHGGREGGGGGPPPRGVRELRVPDGARGGVLRGHRGPRGPVRRGPLPELRERVRERAGDPTPGPPPPLRVRAEGDADWHVPPGHELRQLGRVVW